MSKPKPQPCFDCQELAELHRVTPKRYDDGRHRCPSCRKVHRDKIVASWLAAANRYSGEQNRGGMNLAGVQ
jgi:hypothetical protein